MSEFKEIYVRGERRLQRELFRIFKPNAYYPYYLVGKHTIFPDGEELLTLDCECPETGIKSMPYCPDSHPRSAFVRGKSKSAFNKALAVINATASLN